MSVNLPLDANDEDFLQRGLRRPSIDAPLLPISETFQAVRSSYDNAISGVASTDNIWPERLPEELSLLNPVQRRQYLEQRGLIPPEGSTPANVDLPGIDSLVESVAQIADAEINNILERSGTFTEQIGSLNQRIDRALSNNGVESIPTDSYGQPLIGRTTQPTPLTSPPPGGQYSPPGTQQFSGGGSTVYQYTPIDLYDDRYDFNTGKVIRKGIATGSKGGIGSDDNSGNTVSSLGASTQQLESPPPPANVGPNDTSTEQYDDAILRQARAEEFSSPTVNNETTARVAQQDDQTVDYTDNADADTGDWTPPRRTETSPPTQRASRTEIIASRTQTSQDIRDARSRGENLVRLRRPDGTYYAGPPRDVSDRRLPQRARDMGF